MNASQGDKHDACLSHCIRVRAQLYISYTILVPWEALFSKAPPVVYFRYTMESHMISCGITRYSTVYHVISCGISGYSTGSHMTLTRQKRS